MLKRFRKNKVTIDRKVYEQLMEIGSFLIESENGLIFKVSDETGIRFHALTNSEKATIWASLLEVEGVVDRLANTPIKEIEPSFEEHRRDIKRCTAMVSPLLPFMTFDEVLQI